MICCQKYDCVSCWFGVLLMSELPCASLCAQVRFTNPKGCILCSHQMFSPHADMQECLQQWHRHLQLQTQCPLCCTMGHKGLPNCLQRMLVSRTVQQGVMNA